MKITKRKLKILLEKYIFEDEDLEDEYPEEERFYLPDNIKGDWKKAAKKSQELNLKQLKKFKDYKKREAILKKSKEAIKYDQSSLKNKYDTYNNRPDQLESILKDIDELIPIDTKFKKLLGHAPFKIGNWDAKAPIYLAYDGNSTSIVFGFDAIRLSLSIDRSDIVDIIFRPNKFIKKITSLTNKIPDLIYERVIKVSKDKIKYDIKAQCLEAITEKNRKDMHESIIKGLYSLNKILDENSAYVLLGGIGVVLAKSLIGEEQIVDLIHSEVYIKHGYKKQLIDLIKNIFNVEIT